MDEPKIRCGECSAWIPVPPCQECSGTLCEKCCDQRKQQREQNRRALILIRSLKSELCPACQKKKKSRQTLCLSCYRSLPVMLRKALYAPIGQGYEHAFNDAMLSLEVAAPAFSQIIDGATGTIGGRRK